MHLNDTTNNIEMEENDQSPQNGAEVNGIREPTKSLVVKNIASQIFDDDDIKSNFEASFLALDECATFNYFKSFNRVRVNFSSSNYAVNARQVCHLATFAGQVVQCFLTQPIIIGSGSPHLLPPKREKQFLISPPTSPPVGWEPMPEGQPIINYDILAAISHLAPGESHELHPASMNQPSIIVHVCEEEREEVGDIGGHGIRLPQTARPGAPVASM